MNSPTDPHDAESQVRATIQTWTDAIRRKDVPAVLSLFAAQTVRFFLSPPLETEAPPLENVEAWFRTFEGDIGYEVRQLTLTTSGELAFTNSLNRITGARSDGQQTNFWFRQTLCLRLIDHRWRIIHIHESVPIYLDGTHRAAMDLQPTSLG